MRLGVVARVVLEPGRRRVRELLRLDEVLRPEVGRVDAQLVRRRLHQALDQVRRLGHPERAPVGDAARGLVRVRADRADVGSRDVVGARADVEEPGLEVGRLGVGEERAVVGEERRAQPRHAAVLERQLAVHVVVAREAGRDQVAEAVLDPLHRPADEQRGRRRDDVARVDRHLVPEASADVGRDDPDLVLREPRHDREQRAMDVRGLRRHVDRRLAGRRVDVGDAPAALERRRMAARVEGVERHHLVGLREGAVGGLLVAHLPVVDVVVGLPFLVVADDRRAVGERLLRRGDRRQDLVVDVDQLERVACDVGALGDDRGDLLALEADLVGGEHGLRVARQRRHPRQVVLRHQLARHHGDHARQGRGAARVDRLDPRVRDRAPQELHVEHVGQGDVIDVVPAAAEEAAILKPLHRVSEAARFDCGHG